MLSSVIRRSALFLSVSLLTPLGLLAAGSATVTTDQDSEPPGHHAQAEGSESKSSIKPIVHFQSEQQISQGVVTISGQRLDYQAVAGTLVVHPKDWDDVPQNAPLDEEKKPRPEASMFFVAYFRSGAAKSDSASSTAHSGQDFGDPRRPVTFLFNGGPGSSTVWLHMGAFGPVRVVTADNTHTPAAPYNVVNNDFSLLDASDLVFIDAPGTGFSRIAGTDREKAFYGIDQDAEAFADFIVQFLGKYGRWNSPKYLFGESYGTTRSAVLSAVLEMERDVDLNGVILLSQIMNFDASVDGPQFNPGVELPYELALPTYAATAWYHHLLGANGGTLEALLPEVEQFAMTDYARALDAGATLPAAQRTALAAKLHDYTGLPVDYILKSDLRINGGQFEKTLEGESDMTTGRLDTRFTGPTMDPLSREADYDPQSASISSAYVSAFNDYVRKRLKFGQDRLFKPELDDAWKAWDFKHQPPGSSMPLPQSANVMIDLATAMKYNPQLHVLLNAGYYDLATPFYEGIYEMQHLPVPATLRGNIEFAFYQSGHMVYAHEPALKELHAKVADFIRRTSGETAH